MHAPDFRGRPTYGAADGWPLGYDALEPYYTAAETALGVAGAADDPWASPRSAPFPLPAFAFSHSHRLFAGAGHELRVPLHHLPSARHSVAYAGRSPCRAGRARPGCPTRPQA